MLPRGILAEYNATRDTRNKDVFCHAPFTSLNFDQKGNVTVCCYNRVYRLGRYPGDSLEAMWFGAAADELRTHLKQDVLPPGCEQCGAQLQSRDFANLKARLYDELAAETYPEADGRFGSMPRVMEFEISNSCNLECVMCNGSYSSSIRRNREHLPPLQNPYDKAFVEELKPFLPHLEEARFLGGEPFLVRTYFQIWELIARLNPDVTVKITTNGTVLNPRVRALLESMDVHIILSLDSLERENYERIRVNARFDRVMEHLEYFRKLMAKKQAPLSLAVCPMRYNWRELPKFLEFCNARDIALYFNRVVGPQEASLQSMQPEELREVVEHLKAVGSTHGTELQQLNESHYLGMVRQIEQFAELGHSHVTAAWRRIREGRHAAALGELQLVPETHPEHYDAVAVSGYVQFLLGDLERSEQDLERAIRINRFRPAAFLYRARLRLSESRLDDGIEAAQRARALLAELDPNEADVCELLAELQERTGRHAEALQELDRLVELRPERADVRIGRGWALLRIGRFDEGIEAAQRARALLPEGDAEEADVCELLAELYERTGRHAEALREFDRLVELHPERAAVRSGRGWALLRVGRFDEGIEEARRARALLPEGDAEEADVCELLAALQSRTGRHAEALQEFDRLVELHPERAAVRSGRGWALLRVGRLDEGIEEARRARALLPEGDANEADVCELLAELQRLAGRHAEALQEFDRLIELQPARSDLRSGRGWALLRVGRFDEGIEEARRARALLPEGDANEADVCELLAELQRRTGRHAEALQELDRLVELRPEQAGARTVRGWALLRVGRFDEATEEARRARALLPEGDAGEAELRKLLAALARRTRRSWSTLIAALGERSAASHARASLRRLLHACLNRPRAGR